MKVRGPKKNFKNIISVINTIVDKKNRTRDQRVRDRLLWSKVVFIVYVRPFIIIGIIAFIIGFIGGLVGLSSKVIIVLIILFVIFAGFRVRKR